MANDKSNLFEPSYFQRTNPNSQGAPPMPNIEGSEKLQGTPEQGRREAADAISRAKGRPAPRRLDSNDPRPSGDTPAVRVPNNPRPPIDGSNPPSGK